MLSAKIIAAINAAVDETFDRAKVRFLGPQSVDRKLVVSYVESLTIPGIIHQAAIEEGAPPNTQLLESLVHTAAMYLEGERVRAKAQILRAVEQFLQDARFKGVKTDAMTVLGGQLADLWATITVNVRRIFETEAQRAKNVTIANGIGVVNAALGIQDPVVFFVVVRDNVTCEECLRLHMLDDGITPRCWYISEVGHGYHEKGNDFPSVAGLHPHCRCTLTTLVPGFGFNDAGRVTWIKDGHLELEKQRT